MSKRVSIQIRVESALGTQEMTFGDGVVRIGTGPDCQLRLTDPSVNGIHTILDAETPDIVYVVDVGDNTHVNGKRVRKDRIYPGSEIRIGDATTVVTFLGAKGEHVQTPIIVVREVPSVCIGREAQSRNHQAWCGKPIGPMDPLISDAQRLAVEGTHQRVCPDCVARLTAALQSLTRPSIQRAA